MEYTNIFQGLLLQMQNGGNEFIPFPSVQAGYGPYTSMNAAKTALVDMFSTIANVPQGFTFCVIEDGKPQEYWFTKEGDWSSVEPKNTSSSSTTEVSNVKFDTNNGYVRVSTDGGTTWTNLIALEELRGPRGYTGGKGDTGATGADGDISKIKLRLAVETATVNDETVQRQRLDISYTNGSSWVTVGYIIGGSGGSGGSGVIGIKTWSEDGNQYWTIDGEWLLDDQGHMVRANGIDGRDGSDADGDISSQFLSIAFKRADTKPDAPTGGTYEQPTPVSEGWSDGVPIGTSILWMTTKWFSTNPAITAANHWSEPRQATDTAGIDIEYSNVALDGNPGDPTHNPSNWYDAGTDATDPRLQEANWMAIRTMSNGHWTAWAVFKIRGENGANGVSPNASYKSIIFKKSNNFTEATVDGKTVYRLNPAEYPNNAEGSYETPTPTGWSDGIPATDSNGNAYAMIWMSTRVFSSDGQTPQQAAWTTPTPVGDTADMDFEWCDNEVPTYPYPTRTSPDDANPQYQWSGQPLDSDPDWYDTPSSNSDPIWMAMRRIKNGVYADAHWQVMRVKGEKGTSGTSFIPKGQLFGVFASLSAASTYYNANKSTLGTAKYAIVGAGYTDLYEFSSSNLNGTRVTDNLETGDAYLNAFGGGIEGIQGHVFIWDGDNFIDFGNIQGSEGVGTYFHIKYSANADGYPMSEVPNDYIGIRVDHVQEDSSNYKDYTWMRWTGQDGFGYEYIYTLTSSSTAPNVPVEDITTDEYQNDDHLPTDWTDDPQSPNKNKPYCWVAYRRKIDGVWNAWRGQAGDPTKAALFSMWTSNGRGISGVTEMYAVGASNETPPNLSDFTTTTPAFVPSEGKIYLWNYEVISYDDNTSSSTTPVIIGTYGTGKGIESIVEYYYASASDRLADLPQYGTSPNTTYWKTSPRQVSVNKDTPYLWNYEVIHWTDGTSTFTEPVIIAYYLYTDIEYLTNIFKKVDGDENTAQVGGVVMAVDENQKGTAMLSGKSGEDWGETEEHGRLFIAAGMDGTTTKEGINASTFKVYEDGHVEALDVELRGYLGQYFRRDIDVCDGTGVNKYIKTKTNFLTLGWKGLQYTDENGESVNFNSTLACSLNINNLGGFPEGKIIVSNQFYMDSTGRIYYNSNRGVSIIGGIIIAQDSSVLYPISSNIETIYLRNGWVELTKVGYLDKDGKVIVPNTAVARTVYMITAYGGEVFTTNNRQRFVTDSNGAITNYAAEQERASVRNFEFTDGMEDDPQGGNWKQNVLKIYPTNKYIKCTYDATERAYGVTGYNEDDELYIVLPALFTATTPLRPIVPLGDMKFTILVSNPLPIIRLRTSTAEMYSSITASSDLASLVSPRVWGAVGEGMGISTGTSDSRKLIIEIIKDPTGDISDWIVDARFLPA